MSNALVVPATRLVTVGDRAFPVAGSRLWNNPQSMLDAVPHIHAESSHVATDKVPSK